MGRPMAACLSRVGFQLSGFDTSAEARATFAGSVGAAPASAADAVSGAQVVITLLPDGKIVRAAVEGVKPHLAPGAVLIDMSSSAPVGTKALGEELVADGFEFIDAPVSGGVKRAVDGTLAIMVGGDMGTLEKVRPVLEA